MKIHLLDDRLTARPKHPEFRDRVSLRGAAKKRSSPVDVENVRRAFQAFITPAPTTEGARSFRRRGAHAHRSPGDGACQKQAAERSKCVGPLLGGFGPCCSFSGKVFLQRDEIPTSLWAASSQLLDVTAFPNWQKAGFKTGKTWPGKIGKKKAALKPREGLRRRCRRKHGFSKKKLGANRKIRIGSRTAGTPARGTSTEKNRNGGSQERS